MTGDQARRSEALGRAGLALASELDLPAVLQKIAELAAEVARARYAALGVLGPNGRIMEFLTHGVTDEERAAIGPLPEGHGILGALIHDPKPLRLHRIQDDPRSVGFPSNHPPMTSFVGVPVAIRGTVFGNLYLTEKIGGGDFTEEDEAALTELAAHAAVAIENASLYHEARRQEALARAGLALSTELSLPAVLQLIADLAAEVAGARYAALGVLGPNGRIMEFLTHGVTDEERAAIGPLPEGHGILGALIHDPKPLRLHRIQDDPRSVGFPSNHPPMTSFVGVPVAIRGTVFGNLYLTEKIGGGDFTAADEDAVVTLAAHAAVAIENARLYHDSQLGERRLGALNAVSRAILQGQPIEDVLRLIARSARELVGASVSAIAVPESAGKLIVRAADGDMAEALENIIFPEAGSVTGTVAVTGEPVMLTDAASDPRIHQPLVQRGDIGPALFVPLAVGERSFGTLALANHPGTRIFSDGDRSVAETFAAQAAIALEHARIQDELKRLALVEDRERIAKELHDDVIQSLFAEGMALQAALSMLDDREAMEGRIMQSVEHIDRVIRDLRGYIFALRPGGPADHVLERSLRELAEGFSESGVSIELNIDKGLSSRLASRVADVVQAAREALSNAARHAGGTEIRVSLHAAGASAVLEVADNGQGFVVEQAIGSGHGLVNLDARARALGGELDIESEPGSGTWVRIRFPMER